MSNIIETLVVKVASDITSFEQGINNALKGSAQFEQAINKIGNLGEGITNIGTKISDVGDKLTKKLTAPILGMVTASVKSYADLEQLMGGVDTLFKTSYDKVIANSETAFERAGMSQNQYLDNVMAFSSRLLQGLGGDTEEAARIADMAMTDMSDNANKFGSSIGSVQNAYQGFAKANYTMLDNLKLGYGGTKEEMQRLLADAEKLTGVKYNIDNFDDIINAIHEIQNDLNITGTTAFEATTTISGSFAMAKNSVLDFLSNLGNADADMEVFKNNIVTSVKALVGNVKGVLATIWDNIPLEGWQKNILAAAAAAGPILAVVGKITSGVGGMISMFSKIASFAPMLAKIGPALTVLTGPVGIVVAAIAGLIAIFVGLFNTNEEFRGKIESIWNAIKEFLSVAFEGIKTAAETVFNGLKDFWNTWNDEIFAFFSGIWEKIGVAFNAGLDGLILIATTIFNALKDFWDTWGDEILTALEAIWNGLKEGFSTAINTIISVATAIFNGLKEFWNTWGAEITAAFMGVFNALKDLVTTVFQGIWEIIKSTFDNIKAFWDEWGGIIIEVFTVAFEIIKTLVETVFNSLKKFWDDWGNVITTAFVAVWKLICNAFETALNLLKNLFNIFVGVFTGDWNKVWNSVKGIFETIWNGIKSAFNTVLNAILNIARDIFERMRSTVSEKMDSVRSALSSILDNIRNMFAELPGKALEWGRNLISGFVDGIKSAASWVNDAVSNVMGGVADFIGFNSPSKKGEGRNIVRWGYNMISGFLDGVDDSIPLVNQMMNRVIPNMDDAINSISISGNSNIRAQAATIPQYAGNAMSNKTEITINTEGLFKGAILTVREDSDIEKIVKLVLDRLADYLLRKNRMSGLQSV